MRIENEFLKAKNTISDIHEHIDTLYNLAKECSHITEMGIRNVVSTWAFIFRDPEKLVGIDLHTNGSVLLTKEIYPKWEFIQADTTKIEIEKTDLLFIDTLHTYSQLKKELNLHAVNVNKYIALHDTTTYGHIDESTSGGDKEGLVPAITEFLESNKDWSILKEYTNNNGLTILERNNA